MDRAVHAAPEAAVVWATVCLGLEILENPVAEALENRNGIQYVLSRMEWYWNLVDLLLDENKAEASTAALRDKLRQNIVRLFEKLLSYQMSSICLYHRNGAAVIGRDIFRIDDWAGQLSSIKEVEEAVQRDLEQYNTQQANIRLQKLNVTAAALESNLQDIFAALRDQREHQTKRDEDDKDKQCLKDLRVTDPRTDKKEIEERKGGLLRDSYAWIRDHVDFQRFRHDGESRLLWIKGDPGKGKTMLMCGIIDELERDSSVSLFYFFCQATGGDRLSTATSVLRGLIFDLARHNTQLTKYVRKKYDYAGRDLFSSVNAWQDLSEILRAMLQDPSLVNVVLVVDALDECSVDRIRLLDFISTPSPAKWIVSSRNWLDIEESLGGAEQKVKLHLELNQESISKAVDSYIKYKTDQLAQKKNYDEQMRDAVLRYLTANANGTFLWVALEVLATTLVAYRPTVLEELKVLVGGLGDLHKEEIEEVISSCGSFLTLQSGHVSFVHQSAKDYLLEAGSCVVVPRGIACQHRVVFSRSLELLSATLHRDMYDLQNPGHPIDEVCAPENDPLVAIRYPCVFWAHHLSDWKSQIG
ncbi:Vegetative incompatibility protein HET-E-1 [Emericellopsis cladophorae]|uniref:Vegetative incompatibility protein HET-E-1 n=1 Tax=Emericellopsis cladophorae TaxID=2686198 RepID=A0A9P9XYC8_9HYPO|nr:Vegetative incompatibility protein HET-E-1 [Emericellopsis cladophorae]KAI6779881.1 Vegetative incompatibility protein HET-E-1 [Emericellopsis cladophorae]